MEAIPAEIRRLQGFQFLGMAATPSSATAPAPASLGTTTTAASPVAPSLKRSSSDLICRRIGSTTQFKRMDASNFIPQARHTPILCCPVDGFCASELKSVGSFEMWSRVK